MSYTVDHSFATNLRYSINKNNHIPVDQKETKLRNINTVATLSQEKVKFYMDQIEHKIDHREKLSDFEACVYLLWDKE